MKRALVILLAVFIVVATMSQAVAVSDWSPFYGLAFDEPDFSIGSDVMLGTRSNTTGDSIVWGVMSPTSELVGVISLTYVGIPLKNNEHDLIKAGLEMGEGALVEVGPVDSLAGLPAFYMIQETTGNIGKRLISWLISCEGFHFMIQSGFDKYNDPAMQSYEDQQEAILADFVTHLANTGTLIPRNVSSGGNNGGNSGGGGCNASGGLFSILALVVFSYTLQRRT